MGDGDEELGECDWIGNEKGKQIYKLQICMYQFRCAFIQLLGRWARNSCSFGTPKP